MNRYLTILLFCFSCITATRGQNLVPNPSFEDHVACPTIGGQIGPPGTPLLTVTDWFKPSCGTSDYYNSCGSGNFTVPVNFFGYQPTRTGNAYVGGYMLFPFSPYCREYVEAGLTTTLTAGHEYYVSFWVSLADWQPGNLSAVNQIAACFTQAPVDSFNWTQLSFLTPQIINTANYIGDTLNWVKISGTFVANGTESWILLGNFSHFNNQTSQVITGSAATNNPYYYIDDVCVFDMAPNTQSHDTSLCGLSNGILQGPANMQEYLWNTGATDSAININQPGTYWVKSFGECEAWCDTFYVQAIGDTIKPQLGNDTSLCYGQTLQLEVTNAVFNNYTWSNGATTPAIQVSVSGIYWVTAANNCGAYTDSIHVTIKPEVPVPPSLDTIICTGAGTDIRLPYTQPQLTWYLSPGGAGSAQQPGIDASRPGSYLFYVKQTKEGCESGLATVKVTIIAAPEVSLLPTDTALCKGIKITLGQPAAGVRFLWNTGDTSCCIETDTSGIYRLNVFNECGNYETESQVTFSDCNRCVWVGNAFSPNGDGLNDYFEVKGLCPLKNTGSGYTIVTGRKYSRQTMSIICGMASSTAKFVRCLCTTSTWKQNRCSRALGRSN